MACSLPVQESVTDSGFNESYSGENYSSSVTTSVPAYLYYDMNRNKKRLCIIINNSSFVKELQVQNREALGNDNANLKAIFQQLNFDVEICNDKSVSGMVEIINQASKRDYTGYACFALVILSHGGEDGAIYGTDGLTKLEHLIEPLKGNKVRSLVGKPKLFFIQACRGREYDDGVPLTEPDSFEQDVKELKEVDNLKKIPAEADFLYSYSSVPGYRKLGSWYVQALKRVFEEYGRDVDLLHLLTMVSCEVAMKMESKAKEGTPSNKKKQIPVFVSTLTKLVKF